VVGHMGGMKVTAAQPAARSAEVVVAACLEGWGQDQRQPTGTDILFFRATRSMRHAGAFTEVASATERHMPRSVAAQRRAM